MRSSQFLAVLLHLNGAEQFRPQGLLIADILFSQAIAQDPHPHLEQRFVNSHLLTCKVVIFNFGAGQPFPEPEARRFSSRFVICGLRLFEPHVILDRGHALDAASDSDRLVNVFSGIDEAAQLHYALEGFNVDFR